MADGESISLEETNKIRISLGLKPLTADSPPAASEDQLAEKNYEDERERQRREKDAQRIKAAADKARNKRELNKRLKGATLGDADASLDDAKSWLKASKRREKELAERRQRELESMDQVFQGEDYSEKDLQGLKVSHDLDAIDEGQERILTLKDSRILDNEGIVEDELFDEEMDRAEKDQKRHELKTKRQDYKGYDDEEFAGGEFGKRSVLAKYDEDINGASESGFRIGGPSRPTKKSQRAVEEAAAAAVNKTLLSIDYSKNLEITDYLKESEVGFKKPKTKKKRSTRKVEVDPDLVAPNDTSTTNGEHKEQDAMDVDVKPIVSAPRVRDLDANFVDDDELQAALARSRRARTAKVKKWAPEEMVRQLIEDKKEIKMEPEDSEAPAEDNGLTFDDTTEFIRNVALQPVVVKLQTQPKREPQDTTSAPSPRVKDEPMDEDEVMSELEAGEVDEDEEMNDEEMLQAIESVIQEAEAAVKEEEVNREIGITDEPMLQGAGLAGALSLLRQQGLIAKADTSATDREKIQRERDTWLAEHRRRIAIREVDRMRSRGGNSAQGTSASDAREVARLYESYKPDVNIEYHDEFGRTLTAKEAWKALSHRFHGKGSGRLKTEKRLKKIEEERKREAMASGDTPTGMNEAFQARQERIGQAHMVLSVGQRGAVPQAADVLDREALAKKPKEKTKKKELSKLSQSFTNGDPHGLINVTLPTSANLPASPANFSSEVSPSPMPERFMRPAFARISSVEPSQSAPGSGGASPLVNGERTKVAFGLKRKAADEGEGTPPSKRR
ncbi:SART-1 protein [Calocera viscosa TUFC12733]|uniref:SART-1 protein n=1 Tax=Calocera viscosa (strain TUFC12733) TaxID=1330018 RepID=A0A167HG20_CALVF|nr:SART-1 protein [Calocera viscosa TUFC12733]